MAKQEQQLHVGQHAPNLVQIQRFLGSIDYPVDKEDLIEEAKKRGEDESVIWFLQQLLEWRLQ